MKKIILFIIFIVTVPLLLSQNEQNDVTKLKNGQGDPNLISDYNKKVDFFSKSTQTRIIWRTGSGPYLDNYICYGDAMDPIKFDILIDKEVKDLKNVKLTLSVWDVDEAQGEVDVVTVNGTYVGTLHGANDSWSINNYSIDPSILIGGTSQNPGKNHIVVDLTVSGWCVTVDWGAISADGNELSVVEFLPGNGKLIDYKNPDIRLKFSEEIDATTVNSKNIVLRYISETGSYIEVPTTLTTNKDVITIKPSSNLLDGIKYSLAVWGGKDAIKSKNGIQLSKSYYYDFGTVPDLTIEGPGNTETGVYPTQVVRSKKQIRNKVTAFRIYNIKWLKKNGVNERSQYEKVPVKVRIKEGNSIFYSREQNIERYDLVNTAERKKQGTNTLNIISAWPASLTDGNHNIDLELEPSNQVGNNPVIFKKTFDINLNSNSKVLKIVYHYLLLDKWKNGAAAADATRMEQLMNDCKVFFRDNFPVSDIQVTKGVNINYTDPLARYSWPKAADYRGPGRVGDLSPYLDTVNNIIRNHAAWTEKGADVAFVGLIPKDFGKKSVADGWTWGEDNFTGVSCPFADGTKIILLRDDEGAAGSGANASTVPHEFGHNYSLSTKRFDGTAHTTDQMPTEGFWATKQKNKSSTEGNSDANDLKSLMCKYIEPVPERWICDYDYNELFDNVNKAALLQKSSVSGSHLFISGGYNIYGEFFISPIWENEYIATSYPNSGDLTLLLLTSSSQLLGSYNFNSFSIRYLDGREDTNYSFSIVIPRPQNLGMIQIKKGSTILKEIKKSPNAPQIQITSPSQGDIWKGNKTIQWTGTDPDGEKLLYRVYYSSDNGKNWLSLASNFENTSYSTNTNSIQSGSQCIVRIMATDGSLNTTTKEVSFSVDNGISVLFTVPYNNQTNVSVRSSVEASFTTQVLTTQINNSTFTLKDYYTGELVQGDLTYFPSSYSFIFTPASPLKYNKSYSAMISSGIKDTLGNQLNSAYQWNFTTELDTSDLKIDSTYPEGSSSNIPVNTNITIHFTKGIISSTINQTTFKLIENSTNAQLSGKINYNTSSYIAGFTPDQNLKKETEYKVVLTKDIKSSDNKFLKNEYTFYFLTGSDSVTGVKLTGEYSDIGIDDNNDGLYDWLAIDIKINTNTAGTYSINGKLADKNNNEIVWASTFDQQLSAGVSTIRLKFDGEIINAYTTDGPYLLTDLQIYNTGNTDLNDWIPMAYTTKTYKYTDFQTSNIPVAINLTPPDGAKDVLPNTTISATFTRDMKASTIDSNSFYLSDKSGKRVSAKVEYNSSTKIATLTPKFSLLPDSSYTVTLKSSIKDAQGTSLLKYYNWSFTIAKSAVPGGNDISEVLSYPNPFPHSSLPSGGMKFTYILGSAGGKVNIRVYTITGELVYEIPDNLTSSRVGYNEVYWDGKNKANSFVANGTYVYIIYFKDLNGTEHKKSGKFTVVR
jgi:hypothetical protein